MATTFLPRTTFPPLDSLPRSYFLGHHAAGLAKMRSIHDHIDLVIECRDYRIPFTSRNPMFESALQDKERVMVFTKGDLGEWRDRKKTHDLLHALHQPLSVSVMDPRSPTAIQRLVQLVRDKAAQRTRRTLTGMHCMVVGMPNVGKSTLLNQLRHAGVHRGKSAATGAQPGVTRKMGTAVKIVEGGALGGGGDVYVLDTPGVFVPYVPDAEAMLKLAVCGCVKDTVIAPVTVADYLLFHANLHDPGVYARYAPPTNDVETLLQAVASRTGRLGKGGVLDLDATALWVIQQWRQGHMGRFSLDVVTARGYAQAQADGLAQKSSVNQERKRMKRAMMDSIKARGRRATGAVDYAGG